MRHGHKQGPRNGPVNQPGQAFKKKNGNGALDKISAL